MGLITCREIAMDFLKTSIKKEAVMTPITFEEANPCDIKLKC